MARKPIIKKLTNSRILNEYGGWIYCEKCNKTIAYLCYVTYDLFDFNYKCNCQNSGNVHIEFENNKKEIQSKENLILIKNRLCCPKDNSPLVTILDKNLQSYDIKITCNNCNTEYNKRNI